MQELEAKFLTCAGSLPEDVLRRLQESLAWAGFRVQPEGRRTLTDIYFDTSDQQLRRAGWSYRQRQDASGRRIALKEINRSRAAVFDREEIEQVIPADADVGRPGPGAVQERLSNVLHPEADVAPLFTVEKRRAAYRLSHPDHPRGLVEMAFDDARIHARDDITFTELELELKDGPHELLASILAAVELEPALIEARLSKFERGLITAGHPLERTQGAIRLSLDGQSRWLDVALTHLKAQLVQIRLYEPYAWEGVHPEGVHQMRVATRRARAALWAFAPVLPKPAAARLESGLRWLADVLGDVRDLDVHLAHLDAYRRALKGNGRRALARYESHLQTLHAGAHAALVRSLAEDRYATVLADYRRLLSAALEGNAPELRVADVAQSAVGPLLQRVHRRGRAIDDDAPARHLHRLRIDVKRLRYQLEFLQDAYDGHVKATLNALRKLQDRLGLHQDACVARAHLAAYRKEHAVDKAEKRLLQRLVKLEKKRARHHRGRFARAWQRFERASDGLAASL